MKKLLIATILTITAFQSAFAQVDQSGTTIEHYQYGDMLDIAKVLEIDTPVDVCAVVTSHMIYLDSKGSKHNLEYNIMGSGCQNG
jgi:hypothetical protein